MRTNTELYDQDFYAWTQTTAELIRAGKWSDLDREALAEEIESLGKSDWRELASRIAVLIRHLLEWRYQPERRQRGRSWRSTIWEQRSRLRRLLRQSPSLAPMVPQTIQEEYAEARQRASDETGLPRATFPEACPWTAAQVLDTDFWPEADTLYLMLGGSVEPFQDDILSRSPRRSDAPDAHVDAELFHLPTGAAPATPQ